MREKLPEKPVTQRRGRWGDPEGPEAQEREGDAIQVPVSLCPLTEEVRLRHRGSVWGGFREISGYMESSLGRAWDGSLLGKNHLPPLGGGAGQGRDRGPAER